MSLALISVTRDIAERTSFGRAIKEESGFVYFSAQLLQIWFFWEFRGILNGRLEKCGDAGHRAL